MSGHRSQSVVRVVHELRGNLSTVIGSTFHKCLPPYPNNLDRIEVYSRRIRQLYWNKRDELLAQDDVIGHGHAVGLAIDVDTDQDNPCSEATCIMSYNRNRLKENMHNAHHHGEYGVRPLQR